MIQEYLVVGQRPGGEKFRGIVGVRGGIVVYGPKCLARRPWHKFDPFRDMECTSHSLYLEDLEKFAEVRKVTEPGSTRLKASIGDQLHHKFSLSEDLEEIAYRGRFLQLVENVREKM